MAAVLGGLLLDDGVKLGEEAVESGGSIPGVNLSATPIDDNTRLLLQVAIALLGVVGVGVGQSTTHAVAVNIIKSLWHWRKELMLDCMSSVDK